MPTFDEQKQKKQLADLRLSEEERVVSILSQKYNIPYVDLSIISVNTDALRLIPEETAREARIAGFKLNGKNIFVAVQSPDNEKTVMALKDLERRGYINQPYLASHNSLTYARSE